MTFLVVNGKRCEVLADPDRSLLDVLRNDLALTGSRFGCGQGLCGACMVLVEGRAVHACDTPLWSVAEKAITTVEGLSALPLGRRLQDAFVECGAAQCGYCTSGMLVSAVALLAQHPGLDDRRAIAEGMDRNLCRCGSHVRILAAIRKAAGEALEADAP